MDIFEQLSSSSWWNDATAYVLPHRIDCHFPQIWDFYIDKVLYLLVDTSFFHFFVVFQLFSFVIMLNVRLETGVNLTFLASCLLSTELDLLTYSLRRLQDPYLCGSVFLQLMKEELSCSFVSCSLMAIQSCRGLASCLLRRLWRKRR